MDNQPASLTWIITKVYFFSCKFKPPKKEEEKTTTVLTKDGVSSSLIGFPSKRNRTAPVVIPWKGKYILQIPLKHT